jgi:hypothetical protein
MRPSFSGSSPGRSWRVDRARGRPAADGWWAPAAGGWGRFGWARRAYRPARYRSPHRPNSTRTFLPISRAKMSSGASARVLASSGAADTSSSAHQTT